MNQRVKIKSNHINFAPKATVGHEGTILNLDEDQDFEVVVEGVAGYNRWFYKKEELEFLNPQNENNAN